MAELQTSAAGVGLAAEASREILAQRPDLSLGETIVWDGFGHLSTERAASMSFGYIPFRAIITYAQYHGMTLDESDDFLNKIIILDRILVDAKQREAAKSAAHK